MSGNNCNICRGTLPDYVDGKLDESEAHLLRLHLAASPECAAEEQRLRVLFTIALLRPSTVESIPEPGIFLTGINEGIDRKKPRFYGIARPAFAIPVLTAVLLLVIAGAYFLDFSRPSGSGDTLFPGMLTAEDLRGFDEDAEIIPMLREVTIHDAAATEAEQLLDAADDQDLPFLESEIASTLLGDIPYSSVVSESFDYVTPYDIVDDMDASEFEDIARTIENNRFTLL
jgi:hypothetical protein